MVIIPYMGNNVNLWTVLRYLHPILKRQQMLYQIFVVEPSEILSPGALINAAVEQARYRYVDM